jgi:hypothetical protein
VSEKVEAILESGNYETLTVDFFGSYRVSEKVEAILESGNYETLTVNELFSKLMSSEVDSGGRAKIENPTDPIVWLSFLVQGLTLTHPPGCTPCLLLCPCQMRI